MGSRYAAALLVCLLVAGSALGRGSPAEQTALDRYVAAPDPSYHFQLLKATEGQGYRTFFVELTSQTWLTEKELDRPVWKHALMITVPQQLRTNTGILLIGGGDSTRQPQRPEEMAVKAALATGAVVADLRQVPNQPLTFTDGKPRVEDGIIAYTWDKYLKTGDEKWPARLPMTKAAVRAMDTVTAFCASNEGGRLKVGKFIVAGASKRGWTTWATAAVDDRVVGIIPIVIDTLNVPMTSAHQLAAYGSFSHALKDYEDMKLDRWAGTPQNAALMRIEDPYSYRSRFTMPKLLLNATGDQYFLPDNSQFYFDDLPGPKYLRYVPNTDHSLRNSDAQETLLAFCRKLLAGEALPRLSWTLEPDGSIRARAVDAPRQVLLWQATNPGARDFRLETIGPKWTNSPLERAADGSCVAKVATPEKGWTAFFIEFTYARPGEPALKLTTQVRVVPDVLPYKDKLGR